MIIAVDRDARQAHITIRWHGGAIGEIDLDLPRSRPPTVRTAEDTIALIRRLAVHHPDAVIAGILDRQQRRTARGHRFTANLVGGLRRHWRIAGFVPTPGTTQGELVTIARAAAVLGTAPSTIHRWLKDGVIAGEQSTTGAPWRIRLTDELRSRFVDSAPDGSLSVVQAVRRLGVSRQSVWQRVKRGELAAFHVLRGRHKGLRIKLNSPEPTLFDRST